MRRLDGLGDDGSFTFPSSDPSHSCHSGDDFTMCWSWEGGYDFGVGCCNGGARALVSLVLLKAELP